VVVDCTTRVRAQRNYVLHSRLVATSVSEVVPFWSERLQDDALLLFERPLSGDGDRLLHHHHFWNIGMPI